MGCFSSICPKESNEKDASLYASLVVPKPAPISLESVDMVESGSDIPLFATVISDPETLTDEEINIYTSKLSDSDSA